jgi:hypothetical protein
MDVLRHRLLVVAARGLGGIAKAAQVGRDHEPGLSKLRHERAPHVAVLRVSVEQDHWLALARHEVMEPHPVHGGVLVLNIHVRIRREGGSGQPHRCHDQQQSQGPAQRGVHRSLP